MAQRKAGTAGRPGDGQRQRLGRDAARRAMQLDAVRHSLRKSRVVSAASDARRACSEYALRTPDRAACARSSPAPAARRICPACLRRRPRCPMLGVPVPSKYLRGEDSLLFDRADAEGGIPVATFAIGEAGAANASAVRRRDHRRRRSGRRAKARGVSREADRRPRARCACRATSTAERHRKRGRWRAIASAVPIAPGAWLGLLGGGQLGRMFCMAAQSLGLQGARCSIPATTRPAGSVADRHLRADYLDPRGARRTRVVAARAATTEFENVPAAGARSSSHAMRA